MIPFEALHRASLQRSGPIANDRAATGDGDLFAASLAAERRANGSADDHHDRPSDIDRRSDIDRNDPDRRPFHERASRSERPVDDRRATGHDRADDVSASRAERSDAAGRSDRSQADESSEASERPAAERLVQPGITGDHPVHEGHPVHEAHPAHGSHGAEPMPDADAATGAGVGIGRPTAAATPAAALPAANPVAAGLAAAGPIAATSVAGASAAALADTGLGPESTPGAAATVPGAMVPMPPPPTLDTAGTVSAGRDPIPPLLGTADTAPVVPNGRAVDGGLTSSELDAVIAQHARANGAHNAPPSEVGTGVDGAPGLAMVADGGASEAAQQAVTELAPGIADRLAPAPGQSAGQPAGSLTEAAALAADQAAAAAESSAAASPDTLVDAATETPSTPVPNTARTSDSGADASVGLDDAGRSEITPVESVRAADASSATSTTRSPSVRAAEIVAIREMFEQIDRQRLANTGRLEVEVRSEHFGSIKVEAVDAGDGVELQLRSDDQGGDDLRDLARQLQQEFDREGGDRPEVVVGEHDDRRGRQPAGVPDGRAAGTPAPTTARGGGVSATTDPASGPESGVDVRL